MRRRIYRKRYKLRAVLLALLCVVLAAGIVFGLVNCRQQAGAHSASFGERGPALASPGSDGLALGAGEAPAAANGAYQLSPGLSIHSANAILINAVDGELLYDKDSGAKIYPASMTKIMTAVVALEQLDDLNQAVVLNERVFAGIYQADAMVAGFLPNEEVRAIDLLYGMMLPSGAECAIGLAEYLAGSEAAFVELMNAKAQQLGMDGTHFTNAVGLHDAGHFSTVRDIAVLLRHALGNSTFYQIFTSDWHSSPPTNLHPDGISFSSSLFSIIGSGGFPGGAIIGGKTGYTDEAGLCLASLALKGGGSFILVTSKAPGGQQGQSLHVEDAFTVYAAIAAQ